MISLFFVTGIERDSSFPKFVENAGLTFRLAIIQNTQVEGCHDIYFDEILWRTLIKFMCSYDPDAQVYVAASLDAVGRREIPLSTYLAKWESTPADDRDPPGFVGLKTGQHLRLCIIREYWNRLGGPYPYHDSYTYSMFSDCDLSDAIRGFLRNAPQANRWGLAADVIQAESLPVEGLPAEANLFTKVKCWLGFR